MDSRLPTVVPEDILSSVLCYTFVDSRVLESAPDITTCNTNGYLYEIKDKKVISCLDLNEEQGLSMSNYQIFEGEFVIYYLVSTTTNKLLFIKKDNKNPQIIKVYNNVQEFKVFDFNHLGYPQVKILFFDCMEKEIVEFTSDKPMPDKVRFQMTSSPEEEEHSSKSEKIMDTLLEKLQMVKMHIDELKEEQRQIEEISFANDFSKNNSSGVVHGGTVKFSSALKKKIVPDISISERWDKIFGNCFVFGVKIQNNGHQTLPDLDLYIHHKMIKKYTFCYFSPSEEAFWPLRRESSIRPGEQIVLVGSFQVPPFVYESQIAVAYYLTSSDFEDPLAKGTFVLKVTDLALKKDFQFEQNFTVEDLLAMKALKTETKIFVKTFDACPDLMETKLLASLNFKRLKNVTKLFYCDSTFLREVFILLKEVSVNPTIWQMNIYTSDRNQVYFFVNALYELLPDFSAILPEENCLQ